jgi:hypothetical protein
VRWRLAAAMVGIVRWSWSSRTCRSPSTSNGSSATGWRPAWSATPTSSAGKAEDALEGSTTVEQAGSTMSWPGTGPDRGDGRHHRHVGQGHRRQRAGVGGGRTPRQPARDRERRWPASFEAGERDSRTAGRAARVRGAAGPVRATRARRGPRSPTRPARSTTGWPAGCGRWRWPWWCRWLPRWWWPWRWRPTIGPAAAPAPHGDRLAGRGRPGLPGLDRQRAARGAGAGRRRSTPWPAASSTWSPPSAPSPATHPISCARRSPRCGCGSSRPRPWWRRTPAAARRRLEAAAGEIDRLARLTDGLLTLAGRGGGRRGQRGDGRPGGHGSRPRRRVAPAGRRGRHLARGRGPGLGPRSLAVAGAVEQIVDNYVDNALDVAPAGSTLRIRVVPDRTGVTLHVDGRGARPRRRAAGPRLRPLLAGRRAA